MNGRRHVGAGGLDEPFQQLHHGLNEVVTGLADAASLTEACDLLAAFGVRHLGADAAGVTRQGRRGGRELLAATDPVVATIESARAEQATPLVPGEVLLVRDLGIDPSPPQWQSVAERAGFRSALLLGLPALSGGDAALTLYARSRDAFATRPLSAVAQVVHLAGVTLRQAERRLNLEEALHTRGVIGQAQGLLMGRYGLTSDQAIAYLRRQSQDTHQPIRDLATEVVQRREAQIRAEAHDDSPD